MSESIGLQPWMTTPATNRVLDALEAAGGADCARFVGGCVRNAVMGIAIDDIDIACQLPPTEVAGALQAAEIRYVETGLEHGTLTAICDGEPYEITSLRRDVSTDGRRATVAYTRDWEEDARRRDFRFNSLYADRRGQVFDATGHGVADALEGRVVFVGEAERRIREDFLRILRLFRFYAWYGRAEPDSAAVQACAALRQHLTGLSAERVSKELLKTLAATDPRRSVRLMADTGVLAVVLPEASDLERFERLVELQLGQVWPSEPELRFAALMPDDAAASAAARRLRFSNAQHDRIVAALGPDPNVSGPIGVKATRAAVYRLGAQAAADRLKLAWAEAGGEGWAEALAVCRTWTAPSLPVGGDDAVNLGARGPAVGQALREVEAWWIEHDFPADRGLVLEQLARAVAA